MAVLPLASATIRAVGITGTTYNHYDLYMITRRHATCIRRNVPKVSKFEFRRSNGCRPRKAPFTERLGRSYLNLAAARDGDTEQKRHQQRAERGFARDVAEDAQGDARFSTGLDRIADAMNRALHGFGDLRDGGLRLWGGIQAVVKERGLRDVIAHG